MTRHESFFSGPQGAAEMKHALLKGYLPGFAGATGSRSAGHLVAYVDAFAGPGAYDDGTPGSPSIVLEIAAAMRGQRTIEGYCIESDPRLASELRERLSKAQGWKAIEDTAVNAVPAVLSSLGITPCFVFLDPFGIKAMPYSLVRGVLTRRAKTEALVRFDNAGVWRTGGHLGSKNGSADSLRSLTDFCGGDWWEQLWKPGDGRGFSDAVLEAYARNLAADVGCGYLYFEVADRPRGPAVYHLIHFARHPLAFWKMNEQLSLWTERSGLLDTLMDQPEAMSRTIAENALKLLENGSFVVRDQLGSLLGETLGKARGTHVRAALRTLADSGDVVGPVKGPMDRFRVVPA